jgi:hypothetical protein
MDPRAHAAAAWPLNCAEPAIRLMTRRDLLGEQAGTASRHHALWNRSRHYSPA